MTRVMSNEEYGKEFFQWLTHERGLTVPVGHDVLSRCRRIERTLGVSLLDVVKSNEALSDLMLRMENEPQTFLKPGSNASFGIGMLKHALQCYAQFRTASKAMPNELP